MRSLPFMHRLLVAAAIVLAAAHTAQARNWELDLGLGQSRLRFTGGIADLSGSSDVYVRTSLSMSPRRQDERLRLGIGISFVEHEARGAVRRDDPHIGSGGFGFGGWFGGSSGDRDWNSLRLIAPELTVSWRHHFSDSIYIEPGVGAVILFGRYQTGVAFDGLFGPGFSPEHTRTKTGFGLRPGVRLGYQRDRFSRWRFGLEASYLIGRLDFGDGIGGTIGEFRGGVFVSRSF